MTIYVEKGAPGDEYDWYVYSGNIPLSQHYKKSAAKDAALTEGRQRGAVVKEQMVDGSWRTLRSYR